VDVPPLLRTNKNKNKNKTKQASERSGKSNDVLLSIDGGCSGSGCGAGAAAKRCYDHGG
jgi:hypothetical protein